jgi:hypothetical protein
MPAKPKAKKQQDQEVVVVVDAKKKDVEEDETDVLAKDLHEKVQVAGAYVQENEKGEAKMEAELKKLRADYDKMKTLYTKAFNMKQQADAHASKANETVASLTDRNIGLEKEIKVWGGGGCWAIHS